MNGEPKDLDLPALARAMRFVFVALVVVVSYPNFRLALDVPNLAPVVREMLGDKPLPAATRFVFYSHYFLIGTSFLIPMIAISLVFTSGIARSLYISGILLITAFVQLFTTWHAAVAPFISIFQSNSAA